MSSYPIAGNDSFTNVLEIPSQVPNLNVANLSLGNAGTYAITSTLVTATSTAITFTLRGMFTSLPTVFVQTRNTSAAAITNGTAYFTVETVTINATTGQVTVVGNIIATGTTGLNTVVLDYFVLGGNDNQ
jgi:hypothetical protein